MVDLAPSLVRRLGGRMAGGALAVDGADGSWTAGSGDAPIRVVVRDVRAYGAVLRRGSVGFAESYVAGWWDTDDLTGLVRLLVANLAGTIRRLDRLGRVAGGPISVLQRARPPSQESDRRNVRAHYDLPVELFTAMLDETMTYSCAVFGSPGATLAEAQRTKLDRICTKLGLGPSDHVVEIGSGWGGFAIHAAANYGCRVTTTTVSRSQQVVARRRVAAAGLADRAEVLGLDYRELTGTYDKLVSIEMIEAVDWRRHDAYFSACARLLKPDGLMLLQAIVIADQSYERAKHHNDFIRRMVFPGGCIPSVTAVCNSMTRTTELRLLDLEDIGHHYPPTLRRWHDNLEAHWAEVATIGLDDRFRRLWTLYLCYCEAAFLERHISDVQMVVAGPRFRPLAGACPVRSR